jgi:Ca2+-dependent lipid-binding protein
MLSRNLLIRPISAKLLHDTEFIGKMSPYLRVTAGAEVLKSPACHKGHLTPSWDTELILTLPEMCNSILIELFNKETISKDDFIGSARFDLNQLTQQGFRGWIPLTYSKGDAGTLFIEINYMSPEPSMTSKGLPTGYVQHTPIFNREEGFIS